MTPEVLICSVATGKGMAIVSVIAGISFLIGWPWIKGFLIQMAKNSEDEGTRVDTEVLRRVEQNKAAAAKRYRQRRRHSHDWLIEEEDVEEDHD